MKNNPPILAWEDGLSDTSIALARLSIGEVFARIAQNGDPLFVENLAMRSHMRRGWNIFIGYRISGIEVDSHKQRFAGSNREEAQQLAENWVADLCQTWGLRPR